MAEFPFSLVGSTLNYVLPPSKQATLQPADRIYPLPGEDYVLTFAMPEKPALRQATTRVGAATPDQLIQGRFFEYIQGYVSICQGGAGGFLSGPFTGCWFVRFLQAGAYHAAHIGTTQNSDESSKAKKAFVAYIDRTQTSLFSCFNPNQAWSDDEKFEMMAGAPDCYNLAHIDPAGKCHSLFLVRTKVGRKKLATKTTGHFPRRAQEDEKPGWHAPPARSAAKELFVSLSYAVKGVREVPLEGWPKVRVELLK